MEAIAITVSSDVGNVCYAVHLQNIGWQPSVCDGAVAGITGQEKTPGSNQHHCLGECLLLAARDPGRTAAVRPYRSGTARLSEDRIGVSALGLVSLEPQWTYQRVGLPVAGGARRSRRDRACRALLFAGRGQERLGDLLRGPDIRAHVSGEAEGPPSRRSGSVSWLAPEIVG
jgi:hypothetical protein